jgi:hypothetical protein
VHNPKLPSRDILLNFGLVVRESSASARSRFATPERLTVQ